VTGWTADEFEHGKIAEHWEVVDTGPLVRTAHEPLET
jgi:hypothetical protein